MADVWEKDLAQKSSLTTSDFIRVVGSDNVSYKQLLSNVMTTAGLGELISSSGGWFNATAQTAFENAYSSWADGSVHVGVLRAGSVASFIAYRTSANYGAVQFLAYGANATDPVDIRLKEIYNGTWGSLTKAPTMAEIDASFKLIAGIPASNNINSNDDLNDYTSLGSYACTSGSIATTLVNCPVTGAFRLDVSYGTYSAYVIQDLTPMADVTNIHWRRTRTTGTWGAWTKMPTRAEVDALNAITSVTVTASSGFTSNLVVRKNNKVVTINGWVTASTAFGTSEATVATLDASGRPYSVVRGLAGVANAAYGVGDFAYVSVGTDGTIKITAKSGNTYKNAYFSLSYTTA